MTKASNIPAIEKATGKNWDEWLTFFESIGASDIAHKELVPHIHGQVADVLPETNVWWWSQGVAIAYEQHIGRRVPGQSSDGSYRASASKTFAGDMDEALEAWIAVVDGLEEFGGVPLEAEAGTSSTPKWRYWRAPLADGTRVAVAISAGSPGKSRVAVEHTKLQTEDAIAVWKSYWKELLAEL